MKKAILLFGIVLCCAAMLLNCGAATPVSKFGKLSVKGTHLVDSKGNTVILKGISTYKINSISQYLTYKYVKEMRDQWGVQIIRGAMYTDKFQAGYAADKNIQKYVEDLILVTEKLGVYCMIDWHILQVGDPMKVIDLAEEFFGYMSLKYAGKKHIFYEICNEPNGTGVTWNDKIKPYAERIIPIIRKNDPDSVIIVGTSNWSQDVDIAAADPLPFDNIMYALHFYSGSHGDDLMNRADKAAKLIPLFVTEFGFTENDGGLNHKLYPQETDKWMAMLASNGISWCNWALCEVKEGCAILDWKVKGDGTLTSRLSDGGKLLLQYLKK